jgi:HEPN domain-containing protein
MDFSMPHTPQFNVTRKDTTTAMDTKQKEWLADWQTYCLHCQNGKIEEGMTILNRFFPSREHKAQDQERALKIRQKGQGERRMLEIFYDAACAEIEEAARARLAMFQLQNNAHFVETQSQLIEKIYKTVQPHFNQAMQVFLENLKIIEAMPPAIREQYEEPFRRFTEQQCFSHLELAMNALQTFQRLTQEQNARL